MVTSGFRQADDVYACFCDNRLVFLHLTENKYLCLGKRHSHLALALYQDTSDARSKALDAEQQAINEEEVIPIVRALRKRGIFVPTAQGGRQVALAYTQAATRTLLPLAGPADLRISVSHRREFVRATIKASWVLRCRSMHRIVSDVRQRKQRRKLSESTDWAFLRELVAIFFSIRPFYPRKYLCLYDSLALIEFLALFNLFPQWVFGVTAEPFRAHCWVQEADVILNDSLDFARIYKPIMSI
jgi:hypothetical protein